MLSFFILLKNLIKLVAGCENSRGIILGTSILLKCFYLKLLQI